MATEHEVTVSVKFAVKSLEDKEGEMTEQQAQDAAEHAAFNFLSLVEITGYASDIEEVEVHVEGYGRAKVRLCNAEPY